MAQFYKIPSEILTDQRLTANSLRILIYILDKKDFIYNGKRWDFSVKDVMEKTGITEKKSYQRAINNLKDCNYLITDTDVSYGVVQWKFNKDGGQFVSQDCKDGGQFVSQDGGQFVSPSHTDNHTNINQTNIDTESVLKKNKKNGKFTEAEWNDLW